MRLLDLFAGVGGFSLAAHWLAWDTVAFVEKDEFRRKVLRKNFGPRIPIYDDVRTFPTESFRGRVDIVSAGFPCEPFSNAAAHRRRGTEDERYLFPETLHIVREVRPSWLVLENVSGLASMAADVRDIKMGRRAYFRTEDHDIYQGVYSRSETLLLNRILDDIESEGYAVQALAIPACAVGAPHRRERLWIVAAAIRDDDRTGGGRYASDAASVGLQRSVVANGRQRPRSDEEFLNGRYREPAGWNENWPALATRLCRMDARISDRTYRLKALGSSIVPAIAFEIFRSIEDVELCYEN